MPKQRSALLTWIVLSLVLVVLVLVWSQLRARDSASIQGTRIADPAPHILEDPSSTSNDRQETSTIESQADTRGELQDPRASLAEDDSDAGSLPSSSGGSRRRSRGSSAQSSSRDADIAAATAAPAGWVAVHLRDISVTPGGLAWESGLTSIGDFDGDGKSDLALFVHRPDDWDHDVWVLDPRTGAHIWTVDTPGSHHASDSHTCRLLALGDTNQDKKVELLALTRVMTEGVLRSSVLSLVRFESSDPVWVRDITTTSTLIGTSLARLPDINGDACPDLVVGISSWNDETALGYLNVLSGRGGETIATLLAGRKPFHAGSEIASVPDADGDGLADLIVAARFHERWETSWGGRDPAPHFETYSSMTGKLLGTSALRGDHQWEPRRTLALQNADLNGDGSADVVIRSWARNGAIDWISGKGGALHSVDADPDPNEADDPEQRAFETYDMTVVPDLDGDGWRECLIGQSFARNGSEWGSVGLFSTGKGAPIGVWEGARDDGRFGRSVCWIGDSDGDGEPEFAIQARGAVKIYALRRPK